MFGYIKVFHCYKDDGGAQEIYIIFAKLVVIKLGSVTNFMLDLTF